MLDTDLVQFLRDEGTSAGARVHTGDAPQNTPLPVIIVTRISGQTPRTLKGQNLFARANFTISCIGETYGDTLPLANAVRLALDNYRGLLGTTKVESCRCLAEPADISEIDGDQVYRRVSQEFLFVYRP